MFFGEKKPITAIETTKVLDVFKLMKKRDKRLVILTDQDRYHIKGIIATADICHFLLKGESCEYCSKFPSHYYQIYEQPISVLARARPVIKLHHETPLFIGVHIMNEQNIGMLPLIDKDSDLIGVITERHIAFLLADTKQNLEVKVKDIMTPNVITCTSSQTIGDALHIICEKGFRRIPVVDNGNLVGYFTVKDLLRYFVQDGVVKLFQDHNIDPIFHEKVNSIMVHPVITIDPEAAITQCASVLKKESIGGLPVVEDDKLVGIITEHDIVRAMAIRRS